MSLEPIKTEVRNLLAVTNEDIRVAERTLANDNGRARVRAAGELILLRAHKADLEGRMRELDASRGGAGRTLFQWIRENWMILMQQWEAWLEAR